MHVKLWRLNQNVAVGTMVGVNVLGDNGIMVDVIAEASRVRLTELVSLVHPAFIGGCRL